MRYCQSSAVSKKIACVTILGKKKVDYPILLGYSGVKIIQNGACKRPDNISRSPKMDLNSCSMLHW